MSERTTIYLDIDDDITAIIGKLKQAAHKEVALVVPKRSNVLNSAVNLKLIKKSAKTAEKSPVLITDDSAISRLAGGLNMLVASNLKAEPTVPSVAKPASGSLPSDVIEGGSVGQATSVATEQAARERTYQTPLAPASAKKATDALEPKTAVQEAGEGAGKKSRVPDFNKFKKQLLLGFGALVLFVLLLLSLFFWLPQATITVNGTTQGMDTAFRITADSNAKNPDNNLGLLPAKSEIVEKTLSATFTPTGKKDLGTKASGTIQIRNCDYNSGFSLASGSKFTAANGKVFVATTGVNVPGFNGPASNCDLNDDAGEASVSVQATDNGDAYNIGAQAYSFAFSSAKVAATGTAMSGGSSKLATVVAQQDIDTAKTQQLEAQRSIARKELDGRFNGDQYIIKESFTEEVKSATSSPELDQEASSATLTLKVTYSETAVERQQLEDLIKQEATDQAKKENNKSLGVINFGLDKAEFKPVKKTATAQDFDFKVNVLLGPDINFDELKERVGGKNFSDTVEIVRGYPNVTNVDVKFSPFYVRSVPKKPSKINIKIEVPQ